MLQIKNDRGKNQPKYDVQDVMSESCKTDSKPGASTSSEKQNTA